MRIAALETFPVSVPYRSTHRERSSVVNRGGISDVLIKITTDNGLVGWGESCKAADTMSIDAAIKSAAPFLLGRSPWDREALYRDYYVSGLWNLQAMTGNAAMSGIDMALWDICGKAVDQPVYNFFGGLLHRDVDYMCYLQWGEAEDLADQCRDGVARGHDVFYFKVGVDTSAEEDMLAIIRSVIGPKRRLRVDANQAWSLAVAPKIINRWNDRFDLDFVEAPVRIDSDDALRDVRQKSDVAITANEGLWRDIDVNRIMNARAADILCFSPTFVGSLVRFHRLAHQAHYLGLGVCKHTRGELGICATAAQHLLLTLPNGCGGHQQNAAIMADDVLAEPVPTTYGARWGVPVGPGLGIVVDEERVAKFHRAFKEEVEYQPYGDIVRETV
jgi:L-alanine-DL-glutamate epimerase-like enolase superfamily enzyme